MNFQLIIIILLSLIKSIKLKSIRMHHETVLQSKELKSVAIVKSINSTINNNNNNNNNSYNMKYILSDECIELPTEILSKVLGAAFNSRYMSIESPIRENIHDDPKRRVTTTNLNSQTSSSAEIDNSRPNTVSKRKTNAYQSFYVDVEYKMELSNIAAWEIIEFNQIKSDEHSIIKRSTENLEYADDYDDYAQRYKRLNNMGARQSRRPWECQAHIKWLDLGNDYFPRFLRTIECTKQLCWYNAYVCQAKSFTVKILRRKNGICVNGKELENIGVKGLPAELRDLWVWEERAVNFCCDCVAKFNVY